jgi:2-dehydro-3-deoxyphosphogluconate aldolase/(4S)-4-hydroxy-2-oxoglutarate aldolase
VGPTGFASLRGPFPEVRFLPTGGVDVARAADYLARGAWAVGVGSPLAGSDVLAPGGLERLAQRAREFAQVAADARPFGAA